VYLFDNFNFSVVGANIYKFNKDWSDQRIVIDENDGTEMFFCMATDSAGTMYAGSIDYMNIGMPGGLYKSYDEGDTWNDLQFPNQGVRSVAVDSEGRIFLGTMSGLYKSLDNGNTWIYQIGGIFVNQIAINSEDEVFVGIDEFGGYPGVIYSGDNGNSWSYLEGGCDATVNDIAISPDGYVYLAKPDGVFRSYKPTIAFQSQFVEVNSSKNNLDQFKLKGSLDIELKNIGVLPSDSVSLKAHSDYNYITITDSTEYFGNIIEGTAVKKLNCLSYIISTAMPAVDTVRVDLEMTDSSGDIFYDYIDLVLTNPLLKFSHTVSGSMEIYPENQRTITFRLTNSSAVNITDITTELTEISGTNMNISEPVNISSLPAGNYTDIEYICSVSNLTPTPSDNKLRLTFKSSNGIDTSYDLNLRVGMTEDFETGDLSLNDWYIWGDFDWIIDSTIVYDGKYSYRSGIFGEGVPLIS
jgi:hypothetical protein